VTLLYFANPGGIRSPVRAAMRSSPWLGAIMSPRQRNAFPPATFYCVDNNCGPGKTGQPGRFYPGDSAYLGYLMHLADQEHLEAGAVSAAEVSDYRADPDRHWRAFAAAPDVLGDAAATLRRSAPMLTMISEYTCFRAALVAQNGLEHLPVPWDDFSVLFLGGSKECTGCRYVHPPDRSTRPRCPSCCRPLTEWKLGRAAAELTAEARARGKWVHMGRVNSWRRLQAAARMGCQSADGTYLTRGPGKNLPRLLAWLEDVNDDRPRQGELWNLAA
jgi:hypothetical protein